MKWDFLPDILSGVKKNLVLVGWKNFHQNSHFILLIRLRWWWWWWWWSWWSWWWCWYWWWIVFVVWLTDARSLALFPAGIIVRDSHNRESPTHRKQGLKLRRSLIQGYLNEVVQWWWPLHHWLPGKVSSIKQMARSTMQTRNFLHSEAMFLVGMGNERSPLFLH